MIFDFQKENLKTVKKALKKVDKDNPVEKGRRKRKETYEFTHKGEKTIITAKSYACFLQIYISSKIDILMRTKTINSQCEKRFTLVSADERIFEKISVEEYREILFLYLNYIVDEALNMPVAMEHRPEMTPKNATEVEMKFYNCSWCDVWESRFLQEVSFVDGSILEWIDRCVRQTPRSERVGLPPDDYYK